MSRAVSVLTILVVVISLGACSHRFDPPFGEAGPTTDHDRDGGKRDVGKDAAVEQPFTVDAELNSGCGAAAVPEAGPGGDSTAGQPCSVSAAWVCASPCGPIRRLACFEAPGVVREIRCDSNDNCACVINNGPATPCATLPGHEGRTGCGRAREALLTWGCCAP
ncbi:MAG: hypothetical protein KC503_47315 [Myxococcales bacterium]|nr:hypothetical protein [Myxococcales bacterium]